MKIVIIWFSDITEYGGKYVGPYDSVRVIRKKQGSVAGGAWGEGISQQSSIAVVKVTLQVNGNSQFFGVCPQKNYGAIKKKSGTNDYVGEGNPCKI